MPTLGIEEREVIEGVKKPSEGVAFHQVLSPLTRVRTLSGHLSGFVITGMLLLNMYNTKNELLVEGNRLDQNEILIQSLNFII